METSYPTPAEFFQRLESASWSELNSLVDFFLFEGVPFAMEDWDEYCRFRREISDGLRINAKSIVMVGSGRMGYSLSPNEQKKKLWKPFGDHSDFDVVVVDHRTFDAAWDEILESDDLLRQKPRVKELQQRWWNLYDGIIDVNYLPDTIEFVSRWQSVFEAVSALPWRGQQRTTKGFLFRDWNHAQRHYRKSFQSVLRLVQGEQLPKPTN